MQTNAGAEEEQGTPRPPRPPGFGNALGRCLRVLELLLWIGFFASAALVLGMRYWLLPGIERYRGDIVAAISSAIGLPVTIGRIDAGWLGLRPQLAFSDVRIFDHEGRAALVLPSVENVLSWRSLLFRDLRLHSLAIDSPRLAIRRAGDGALFVAGMRIDPDGANGRLADWILGQREIVVRNAEIRWLDEQRAAPPLELAALNFRLINSGDEHLFGLSARPPPELGGELDVRGALVGESIMDPAHWSGRLYAELGYTDLAGWRAWLDYPPELRGGQGALRLWANLEQGRARRATVDLALTRASLRLAAELPILDLASVRGRLQGRSTGKGYEVSGHDLALALENGPRMLPANFVLSWRPEDGADLAQASLAAAQIELMPLARLAEYLPLPSELRAVLREAQPEGKLLDARLTWYGRPAAVQGSGGTVPDRGQFSIQAKFAGLGMKAYAAVPGFSGLSGSVDANAMRASVRLASNKLSIELPEWFSDPHFALDSLAGRVEWQRPALGPWSVRVADLTFANEHLAGSASANYAASGQGQGNLDLSAQLGRADARFIAKYLPNPGIMGMKSREWLAGAVLAGRGSDVKLRLKGNLGDFPFIDPAQGTFLVTARVSHGVLEPMRGWPRIEAIDGALRFERNRFAFEGRSATILGARVSNARVVVPALRATRSEVSISGTADGPSAEFLRYVAISPVRRMIDGGTDTLTATGAGRLQLRLDLLPDDLARSRVSGDYQFANNSLVADPHLPALERATGRVNFSDSGISIPEIRGQFLGGPVQISGGSKAGAGVSLVARGEVQVQNLRPLFDHPWRRQLSGAAPYAATLLVNRERTQLTVESGLRGVASALPPPLAKRADETLALRVDLLTSESGMRDRVSLTLGRLAAAEFLRRKQGNSMQVQRASIALSPAAGQAMRVPARSGTLLYGSLGALDLDRWRPLFAAADASAANYDLAISALDLYGRRLHEVELRAGSEGANWSARIKSREVSGELAYRAESGGRLIARLEQFQMPETYPGAPDADPVNELPAVDLIAERFVLRGKQYGRVEIAAQRSGLDWRIDKLSSVNPESSLSAKGIWRAGAEAKTSLTFDLQASDAGKFLDRVGYPNLLKGGTAKLNGALEWSGDPLSIDYPSMHGDMTLEASEGQFVEIEPGIGKLVSLMSLQMLPRRITLDFRDVFSKGFQFDRINSSMHIERGVLKTSDFKMRGSAAEVDMAGETNLARETQNLRVRVVPSLGDSASTVLSVLGGPIAGVASMIAQRVLKNPLGQIFSYEYVVSGTWSDPKVDKAGTKAAEPEPGGATLPGNR